MDKISIGMNVDLGDAFKDLQTAIVKFKETRTYDKSSYNELLDKYIKAVEVIETLKNKNRELEQEIASKKLPSGEEIDNLAKMLDIVGVLNEKMPQIQKLQKSINKFS